jgi:C-5 cytosine-specific DNA methylase
MNVLDVYAGTGSATRAFANAGHSVMLLELDGSKIDPDLLTLPNVQVLEMDARRFAESPRYYLGKWTPDFIWLSPPCQAFSMAGSGSGASRWGKAPYGGHPIFGPRIPIKPVSRLACDLVIAGLTIKDFYPEACWLMENPRAGLRTMGFMRGLQRWTITHCQYGDTRMKPTDLWGEMPAEFNPKPACVNGDSCHVSAPRGSKTPGSTQGIDGAKDRGRLPLEFSEYLLEVMDE